MSRVPRWCSGDTILWTYADPARPRLLDQRPVTVFADAETHPAVWLDAGNRMLHQALADGSGSRGVTDSTRFTAPRVHGVEEWQAGQSSWYSGRARTAQYGPSRQCRTVATRTTSTSRHRSTALRTESSDDVQLSVCPCDRYRLSADCAATVEMLVVEWTLLSIKRPLNYCVGRAKLAHHRGGQLGTEVTTSLVDRDQPGGIVSPDLEHDEWQCIEAEGFGHPPQPITGQTSRNT